jgi:hypothetical protein
MMRDLFSDLPEPHENDNYATRLARSWIKGDSVLTERCLEVARCLVEDRGNGEAFTAELRAIVVTEALVTERHALFVELFTRDSHEIHWSDIAASFLEEIEANP